MVATAASRRRHILDQAERLFAEHGYHDAALAEIARAAGLGNAGLIHHFPSKPALYRAVLERLAEEIDGRLAAAIASARGVEARLRAFVRILADWSYERPLAVRLIPRELLDNSERVATARVPPLSAFVVSGKEIIADAQAAGLVTPCPAEVVLTLIIGSSSYAAVVRPTFRQILRTRLLKSERRWLDAIADKLLVLLLGLVEAPARKSWRRKRQR